MAQVLIFTMVMHYIMLQVVATQLVTFSYCHFMLDVVELITLKRLVPKPMNQSVWRQAFVSNYRKISVM
jgi:uncharacterized membrane protein